MRRLAVRAAAERSANAAAGFLAAAGAQLLPFGGFAGYAMLFGAPCWVRRQQLITALDALQEAELGSLLVKSHHDPKHRAPSGLALQASKVVVSYLWADIVFACVTAGADVDAAPALAAAEKGP